jgi:hypothetical protein
MGKLLIWFGILYGNLVALVGLAVITIWWTKESSGRQFCQAFGLGLTGCRSLLLILDFVVMGTATFLSFRRMSTARKNLDNHSSTRSGDGTDR